jgi:hypothetical protein|tara:strand:- start:94 stop:1020 length:927 start_codon:yes stop_codon:yes gene_type:complete
MAFPTTPEWAANKNYLWHSNPESRPICRTYFDKCIIRPKVNYCYQVLKDELKGDKAEASQQIDLYNNDAAKMMAGRTIQTLADDYLINKKADTIEDAIGAGAELFNEYKPRTWDDGKDERQHELNRDSFSSVLKNALEGIQEAQVQLGLNTLTGETEIMASVPGLALPFNGRPDYSGCIELKTTWASVANTKSGKRSASLPTQPSWSHLCQVSGYWFYTKRPQALVYSNETTYRIFTAENCERLTEEGLAATFNWVAAKCRIREHQLKSAESVNDLIKNIEPDFGHMWAWDIHPEVLKEAKQLWGFIR